jgi:hypothetical protein
VSSSWLKTWIPAFSGMTLGSVGRGSDWLPVP